MNDKKKRYSIYAGPPLDRLIQERTGDFRPPTAVVNTVADRYLELVERHRPALTVAEWALVFDALNGTITWDSAEGLAATGSRIAHAIDRDGLAEKWGVDGPALLATLRGLSYAETVALVDVAERFWARFGNTAVEIEAALAALGVR